MKVAEISRKRIAWVTNVKALCMLFVYFSHSTVYYCQDLPFIRSLYEPFYVNAFFVVSGFLLFRKFLPNSTEDFSLLLKNILNKLILPSLIFAIITFFPKMLFSSEPIVFMSFFDKTIGGMTYWFVSALVVAELIFWILFKSRSKNVWFYYLIASSITCLTIIALEQNWLLVKNYWMFKQGLLSVYFLGLGGLYWKYETFICKIYNIKVILLFIIIYLGFVYAPNLCIMTTISMCKVNYIGLVIATFSCLLLISITKYLSSNRFMQFIGDNSIGFYFFCGIFPIFYSTIFNHFFVNNAWLVLLVFAFSVFSAAISVYFIHKYCPCLFDFGFIARGKRSLH